MPAISANRAARQGDDPSIPTPAQIRLALRTSGVEIEEPVACQVAKYIVLLLRWSARVALTTLSNPGEIVDRHFGESFLGAKVAAIREGRLLDVGSGAGFPGVPIALVAPSLEVTLLEPNLKKAVFLKQLCLELALRERVRVERSRFEDFGRAGLRFDFITSRAVKVTPSFLKLCARILIPGGKLVLWVGLEDAERLFRNQAWLWSEPVNVPGSHQRVILCGSLGGR